jgi:hypothetical protein
MYMCSVSKAGANVTLRWLHRITLIAVIRFVKGLSVRQRVENSANQALKIYLVYVLLLSEISETNA